jgi:hypothetical protein
MLKYFRYSHRKPTGIISGIILEWHARTGSSQIGSAGKGEL